MLRVIIPRGPVLRAKKSLLLRTASLTRDYGRLAPYPCIYGISKCNAISSTLQSYPQTRHYATSPRSRARPSTSKASGLKSTTTRKKPAKKRTVKKKVTPKRKAPKPKRRLSELEQKRQKVRQLRSDALLTSKPKGLPVTSYAVYMVSQSPAHIQSLSQYSKEAAARWRQTSVSEKEVSYGISNEGRPSNSNEYLALCKHRTAKSH